ncbi:bifunctional transcriptional activator/DNA repair enzyme AdaA [Paenibacillus daejeonensis]|uniref:bifunctional transcriptional activator/DNA repair enzyme AdaA n=1 Tax=Paenibacillus daejeonensis TaxID=135193 RepID=UPI00036AA4B8|nr:bifunctional transcriptional activator/DNA repair enzyme AdaA [Paenibacillus daejeonensis]
MEIDEELQWQAVLNNDASHDGRFWYAVRTTGIFCRPSCKSRPPKRAHVQFYDTIAAAQREGYRPCKRCLPHEHKLPEEAWISRAAAYMDRHYAEELTLHRLAEACHGSPYHLQRTFKRIMGITPTAYLQQLRISRAQELLRCSTLSVRAIGQELGLSNLPYFITLFKRMTGSTPARYRQDNGVHAQEAVTNE